MATREESITDYQQALLALDEVNHPQITLLTMLAKQHAQYAQEIVCAIETHILMVKPNAKLPAIYLIDSIVKNLPQSPYKSLLMKNIVHTFTSVFKQVDRATRSALFEVRQSWVGVFPNNKLYSLDWYIKTHLDPAWPITAIAPVQGSSHVDPRCPQIREQRGRSKKRGFEVLEVYETRAKRLKREALNLVHNMSDLAGRLHQDHKNGHTHPSSTFVDQKDSLQFQSSNNKGWHDFKKSHSEDYGMPQTTNTTSPDNDIFSLISRLKEVGIIPSTSSQEPATMKEEPSLAIHSQE